jgi:hypothetical protein
MRRGAPTHPQEPSLSNFIIRVSIHESKNEQTNYETLHQEMAKISCHRVVVVNGTSYWLPEAEYSFAGELNIGALRNQVVRAASAVATNFGVVVSRVAEIAIHNLGEIAPSEYGE